MASLCNVYKSVFMLTCRNLVMAATLWWAPVLREDWPLNVCRFLAQSTFLTSEAVVPHQYFLLICSPNLVSTRFSLSAMRSFVAFGSFRISRPSRYAWLGTHTSSSIGWWWILHGMCLVANMQRIAERFQRQ